MKEAIRPEHRGRHRARRRLRFHQPEPPRIPNLGVTAPTCGWQTTRSSPQPRWSTPPAHDSLGWLSLLTGRPTVSNIVSTVRNSHPQRDGGGISRRTPVRRLDASLRSAHGPRWPFSRRRESYFIDRSRKARELRLHGLTLALPMVAGPEYPRRRLRLLTSDGGRPFSLAGNRRHGTAADRWPTIRWTWTCGRHPCRKCWCTRPEAPGEPLPLLFGRRSLEVTARVSGTLTAPRVAVSVTGTLFGAAADNARLAGELDLSRRRREQGLIKPSCNGTGCIWTNCGRSRGWTGVPAGPVRPPAPECVQPGERQFRQPRDTHHRDRGRQPPPLRPVARQGAGDHRPSGHEHESARRPGGHLRVGSTTPQRHRGILGLRRPAPGTGGAFCASRPATWLWRVGSRVPAAAGYPAARHAQRRILATTEVGAAERASDLAGQPAAANVNLIGRGRTPEQFRESRASWSSRQRREIRSSSCGPGCRPPGRGLLVNLSRPFLHYSVSPTCGNRRHNRRRGVRRIPSQRRERRIRRFTKECSR